MTVIVRPRKTETRLTTEAQHSHRNGVGNAYNDDSSDPKLRTPEGFESLEIPNKINLHVQTGDLETSA